MTDISGLDKVARAAKEASVKALENDPHVSHSMAHAIAQIAANDTVHHEGTNFYAGGIKTALAREEAAILNHREVPRNKNHPDVADRLVEAFLEAKPGQQDAARVAMANIVAGGDTNMLVRLEAALGVGGASMDIRDAQKEISSGRLTDAQGHVEVIPALLGMQPQNPALYAKGQKDLRDAKEQLHGLLKVGLDSDIAAASNVASPLSTPAKGAEHSAEKKQR